jgi:two-component system NtrC family sensor kinase
MRGRVLLVEDNRDVADVSIAHLTELGFEVDLASDVRAAMELLGAESFDLVVSDVVIPGGATGLDLARVVRARHPGLPFLLATGYSAVADEAVAEGFALLRKPFDLRELASAIDGLARGAPAADGPPHRAAAVRSRED